jgi:hypothetical protein
MNRFLRLARLHKLMDQADDGSGQGKGGGGGGADDGSKGNPGNDGKGAGDDGSGQGKGGDDGKGDPANKGGAGVSDEVARLVRETMQRKEKIENLNKELGPLKELAEAIKGLGGLEAIKGLVSEKRTAEEQQLEAKGEWDRLKARMAEENQRVVAEKDGELAKVKTRADALEAQINELTIGAAFNQSKFIPDSLLLTAAKARVVYGSHFELVDGAVVAYDKPRGAANRTPLVDSTGTNLAFEQAIQKLVEADPEKDQILKSKVKPGAGSESRREQGVRREEQGEQTGIDKIKAGIGALGLNVNSGKL